MSFYNAKQLTMIQEITSENSASAKKEWKKPELFVLDSEIQSGLNATYLEGVANPAVPGPAQLPAGSYHS